MKKGNGQNYRCDLEIPDGVQSRCDDAPDAVATAPDIKWEKHETVIRSAIKSQPFSFDLEKVCNWK